MREFSQGVDQEVLQYRYVRLLSAHPGLRAGFAFRRLFTLIAKHTYLLLVFFCCRNSNIRPVESFVLDLNQNDKKVDAAGNSRYGAEIIP
jgi:hypothetical protein